MWKQINAHNRCAWQVLYSKNSVIRHERGIPGGGYVKILDI